MATVTTYFTSVPSATTRFVEQFGKCGVIHRRELLSNHVAASVKSCAAIGVDAASGLIVSKRSMTQSLLARTDASSVERRFSSDRLASASEVPLEPTILLENKLVAVRALVGSGNHLAIVVNQQTDLELLQQLLETFPSRCSVFVKELPEDRTKLLQILCDAQVVLMSDRIAYDLAKFQDDGTGQFAMLWIHQHGIGNIVVASRNGVVARIEGTTFYARPRCQFEEAEMPLLWGVIQSGLALGKLWDEIVTCAAGYAVIASAATSSRWDEMLTKIESLPRLPFVFPKPKPSIQISVKVSMLLSSIVRTVGRVK